MTQPMPRLFNEDASTWDPNSGGAVPGEIVAEKGGGAGSRVGLVRETAGGMKFVELVVGDVNVAITVTKPGAFQQRVLVTVTDRHADPIIGAIVQVALSINAVLTAVAPTGTGKVLASVVDALDSHDCTALMEMGALGTASMDFTTGGAAAGEVYAVGMYPGPGRDSETVAFTA